MLCSALGDLSPLLAVDCARGGVGIMPKYRPLGQGISRARPVGNLPTLTRIVVVSRS